MLTLPSILVCGGERKLLTELEQRFSATVCHFIQVQSLAEAHTLAESSSLIVIESSFNGSGADFCRQLKKQAATSKIPLILRVPGKAAAGLPSDIKQLPLGNLEALLVHLNQVMPALTPPKKSMSHAAGDAEDEDLEESATIATGSNFDQFVNPKKPHSSSPPPVPPSSKTTSPVEPPVLRIGQLLEEYIEEYQQYLGGIIQKISKPASHDPALHEQLIMSADVIIGEVEHLLEKVQSAINESLMAKDLNRMRSLSTAKNNLYEKLKQLRPLVNSSGTEKAQVSSSEKTMVAGKELHKAPLVKSELTRAAEAKGVNKQASPNKAPAKPQAKDIKQAKDVKGAASPAIKKFSARKEDDAAAKRKLMIVAAIVVVLGGLGLFFMLKKKPVTTQSQNGPHSPPVMKQVFLDQTPAGFVVRPVAEDQEKDPIQFIMRWFVNSQEIPSARSARLRPNFYKSGDRVQVEVTPTDGVSKGEAMSSKEMVANASGSSAPRVVPKKTN